MSEETDALEFAVNGKVASRIEGYTPCAYFDRDGEIQFAQVPIRDAMCIKIHLTTTKETS